MEVLRFTKFGYKIIGQGGVPDKARTNPILVYNSGRVFESHVQAYSQAKDMVDESDFQTGVRDKFGKLLDLDSQTNLKIELVTTLLKKISIPIIFLLIEVYPKELPLEDLRGKGEKVIQISDIHGKHKA